MANYVKFFISIFGVILLLGIPEHAKAEKVYSSNIVVLSEREIIIDTSYEKKIDNSVDLKLINTGREAWSKEKIRLSYHLINKNNEVVLNDGARTLLPQDIKPGGYINIKPNIEIPSNLELNEQLYIQFDLVSEGEMWFSEVDKKNSIVLPIKFIKNYDFEILNPVKSISVWGKEKKQIKLKIKNTGNSRWETYSGISLSYDILDKDNNLLVHDGVRSTLPYAVGPGEEVDINASIAFPGNTGKYIIQWDMVNEGFGWFGNGKFVSEKQTKITFHSEFWIYLIWFFTFLLMVYLSVLISDFIKTKTLGFRKSIQSMFFVLIGYFDIIWITISLYFKVKWGTVLISGDINSVKLMVLGVIITALVLNCFINRKIRFFVTILLNIMVSLLIFSDLIYFRYFNDVITTGTIFNAKQLANVTDSISNLIDYKYAIYLFFDIFMFAILYIFLRTSFPKNGAIKKSRIIYSLVLLVSTLGISGVMFNNLAKEDLFQKKYQNKLIVQDIGLINFHLYDFTSYLGQKIRRISPSELKEINEWKSEKDNDKYDQYFGIARNKNVILIQSEALQNFVINLTYNNQVITPNLNKFASNNLYFNNFYDQTGPGRTSDAEFISLNSLFGLQSGSVYTTYNNNKLDSLPKILNENNYDTMSAHGYNGAFWSRSRMHRLQGFQKSYFQEDLVLDEKIGWGLSDKTFLRQSLDKMISLKQPFFSFLITLSNHHPYNERLPVSLNLGELEGTILGNYLNSVHYADYAFGEFMNELEKRGMLQNTVVAIYGDHDAGISLEELSKILKIEKTPEQQLLLDKVPFIIHIPGVQNSIIATNTGHLDITPTLLHILGIKHNNNVFLGENIFSKQSPVIFRNGNYIGEDFISVDGACYGNDAQSQCDVLQSSINNKLWISDSILRYNLIPNLLRE